MGLFFGALTALSIGLSDLFGRRVVNAQGAVAAAAVIQLVAIGTSIVALRVVSSSLRFDDFAIGLVSGLGLGVGLWGYLSGLEHSSSAVVAPIVATMSAVIPYAYAVLRGNAPAPMAVVGAVVALAGLVVITFGAGRTVALVTGLRWGGISGLGYGVGLSVIVEIDEVSGAWPSVAQRMSAFGLLVIIAMRTSLDWRPPHGLRTAAGAAGVAAGLSTIFFLFGVQADATSAIVLASLFPAVSVVVGRVAYGDEVTRSQVGGLVVVLLGIIGVSIA